MTDDDNRRQVVDLFLHGLEQLRTDDRGLLEGHDMHDLNAVAFLCLAVKTFTAACGTPEDILLYDLADKTERLLVSSVVPSSDDVSGIWWRARADLVNCQLGGL